MAVAESNWEERPMSKSGLLVELREGLRLATSTILQQSDVISEMESENLILRAKLRKLSQELSRFANQVSEDVTP